MVSRLPVCMIGTQVRHFHYGSHNQTHRCDYQFLSIFIYSHQRRFQLTRTSPPLPAPATLTDMLFTTRTIDKDVAGDQPLRLATSDAVHEGRLASAAAPHQRCQHSWLAGQCQTLHVASFYRVLRCHHETVKPHHCVLSYTTINLRGISCFFCSQP